jgi:PPK2 family polyphosphate:nucleotide phosphotransferase
MLALSAAPMSPTALPMNAFNLSGLTAMMHLPLSHSAHSLPLARGCQARANGVEYRFEHEPEGTKEAPSMKDHRVKQGSQLNLDTCDPDDTGEYKKTDQGKEKAKAITGQLIGRLEALQERLYANGDRSVLIVLQGMDTSGKDGTIKHVMSGVNPQGCKVVSFKPPSPEELGHDFLWRVHQKAPSKGQIGIFNRSHYEDVLITRVHGWVSETVVKQRFNQIKEFEELLHENGTTILKFFLHISKDEQKERLEERLHDPEKRWKFNEGDLEERKLWKNYMEAFEDMMAATSTDHAPWYIVPANRKWYRNLMVADRVVAALEDMKLKTPPTPANINFDRLKIV